MPPRSARSCARIPNTILVGEIRDFETAEIAVKAALTGHLVLSTLHTNDAPSTVSRLMNMGIEPFLVASSVNLICAQRLVRRVCSKCKVPHPLPPQALIDIGFSPEDAATVVPMRGTGCDTCNQTGYKGRVGLYEVLEITDALRELILVGASALDLRKKGIEEGMITLRQQRPPQGEGRRDHHRGSHAGDGQVATPGRRVSGIAVGTGVGRRRAASRAYVGSSRRRPSNAAYRQPHAPGRVAADGRPVAPDASEPAVNRGPERRRTRRVRRTCRPAVSPGTQIPHSRRADASHGRARLGGAKSLFR